MKRLVDFLAEKGFKDIQLVGMDFFDSDGYKYMVRSVRNVEDAPDFKKLEKLYFDGRGDIVYLDTCLRDRYDELDL